MTAMPNGTGPTPGEVENEYEAAAAPVRATYRAALEAAWNAFAKTLKTEAEDLAYAAYAAVFEPATAAYRAAMAELGKGRTLPELEVSQMSGPTVKRKVVVTFYDSHRYSVEVELDDSEVAGDAAISAALNAREIWDLDKCSGQCLEIVSIEPAETDQKAGA